jgi:3-isopropylmalate/(R)-2-methylmalate dehydratase small subunit
MAGESFGCGSSREHAPWALYDHGFRAIVSTSIADISQSNALKNGLTVVTVSLEEQTLALADGTTISFPIDPFARLCLINGHDELDYLLSQRPASARFEATPR